MTLLMLVLRMEFLLRKLVFDTTKIDGAPIKIMDSTRCEEVFNWLPQMPFEEGITNAVQWYIDHAKEV